MNQAIAVAAALAALGCSSGSEFSPPPAHDRSLVVLGIDGMDPVLLEKYWAQGKLPNLKALAHTHTHTLNSCSVFEIKV